MRVHSCALAALINVALVACGSGPVDIAGTGGAGAGVLSGGGGGSSTSGSGGGASTSGSGGGGGPMGVDDDGDGLDDAYEAKIAQDYLPFLAVDAEDGCPLGGIVYRVRPHPMNAAMLLVIYDHLFENDCGLGGHVGDNEVFGITVDPSKPPPAGIVAMRGVSHQGTFCEKKTGCGVCPGESACTMAEYQGASWPVVFSSKDKHATYVQKDACELFTTCFDTCSLPAAPATPPMVNAGEPGAHLTEDLTTNGFITAANGWTEMSVFNYNPWDPDAEFGGAGKVAEDLVDPAFEPPVCP